MAQAKKKRSAAQRAPSAPALPPYAVATWSIDKLKPYDRNARVHGKAQIQQLRDSFRRFGQVWPILVRADGTIIAGHGRLEAAKAEKFRTVQVIVATGWSDEQCRAFGLLDNRVPLNAEWDEQKLGIELAALSDGGLDLSALGFTPLELNTLTATARQEGLTDPDDVPEEPAIPVSRLGDLWVLGRHRIICGDSTKAEDVVRVLGDAKPHLMVTDPPYGVEYDPAWRNNALRADGSAVGARATGQVLNDSNADWRAAWILFTGDVAYVWHAGLFAGVVAESLEASGFRLRSQIIWAKSNFAIGRGDYHWKHEPCWYAVREKAKNGHWSADRKQTTVWDIAKPAKSESGHGTQKPIECMLRPIENNSSPGQAVYEPFSGSGTTILAAQISGRAAHAVELNPAYVDVAVRRWEQYTGETASLDGDGRDFATVAAERVPRAA